MVRSEADWLSRSTLKRHSWLHSRLTTSRRYLWSFQTIISTCSPSSRPFFSHIIPFASGASPQERSSAHLVLMAPVSDGVRTMARAGGAGLAYQKWFLSQELRWRENLGAFVEPLSTGARYCCSTLVQSQSLKKRQLNRERLEINLLYRYQYACPVPKVVKRGGLSPSRYPGACCRSGQSLKSF